MIKVFFVCLLLRSGWKIIRKKKKTVSCQCEFRTCAVVSGAKMRTKALGIRVWGCFVCFVFVWLTNYFFLNFQLNIVPCGIKNQLGCRLVLLLLWQEKNSIKKQKKTGLEVQSNNQQRKRGDIPSDDNLNERSGHVLVEFEFIFFCPFASLRSRLKSNNSKKKQ